MNPFANIFEHPRTSVAGVLISVATVAGVLAQQGVTLGTLHGGGNVVSLAAALATALLGLMARDPGAPADRLSSAGWNPGTPATEPVPSSNCAGNCRNTSGATAKLSVWLLILLLIPLPWLQGCTASNAAQGIVNWTPALQSAVATVDSTAALLAPADAPIFTAATAGFDAASNLLVAQAKTYLANPTAGILAQLQAQVVTLQQQVSAALLSAARIADSASQQHAMAAIQAVATIVTAILAILQSVSTKAQVAQMAAHSTIKLAAVEPYLDRSQSAQLIATHYNEPVAVAIRQCDQTTEAVTEAGF